MALLSASDGGGGSIYSFGSVPVTVPAVIAAEEVATAGERSCNCWFKRWRRRIRSW